MKKIFFVLAVSTLFVFSYPMSIVSAYYTNMPASVVIGQPDFVSNSANQGGSATANTLSGPRHGIIAEGKLIVVDSGNKRVLIWNRVPISNNIPADVVIGQTSMSGSSSLGCTASGLNVVDSDALYVNGKLLISDIARVLVFNHIPATNGASADVVIGQPNMITCGANTGGIGSNTLNSGVTQLASDGTKLFVADSGNNRVLIFNSIPATNGASADVVVGQSDFISLGTGTTASTMNNPRGVAFYNGKLIVGERANFRITIFNSIPTTNGASADVVLGQADFTSSVSSPPSTSSTVHPFFISVDGKGRLYTSDRGPAININRYLIWNYIPTTNNVPADIVIGQPDFTSTTANNGGLSARSINGAKGIFANDTQMVIAEPENNRVLIFPNTISTPQMNINLPLEKIDDTHLRVRGNVQLGDRPNYSLQWIKAEVNGQGLGYVTSLGGGRDNGDNLTLYDFFHEFNPTTGVNTDMNNYTLKLVASSFNADTTSLFYFLPFNLKSLTRIKNNLIFDFSVNKQQIQKIKDNVDHFEIQTSTDSGKFWKKLSINIPTDKIDTNSGQVYVTTPNTLLPGTKYWTRIIAVSRDSNWQEPSNTLNYFVPKKK